jgi:NAD(P)-dependent dehydrogenase (short-subunit alcohol dehydrogenase family)
VEEIRNFGAQAYAHQADVSHEDQIQAMFQRMFQEFGTVDILIKCRASERRPFRRDDPGGVEPGDHCELDRSVSLRPRGGA